MNHNKINQWVSPESKENNTNIETEQNKQKEFDYDWDREESLTQFKHIKNTSEHVSYISKTLFVL